MEGRGVVVWGIAWKDGVMEKWEGEGVEMLFGGF